MSSGAYTDLIVDNLYINSRNNGVTNVFQSQSLGIHQMIGGAAWGWSPPIPGHTSVYFGQTGGVFWEASSTPPSVNPSTFIVPAGGENYGSINLTLPQGNYIVSFLLASGSASGIAQFTINDGSGPVSLPDMDLYVSGGEYVNYPIVINNTSAGLTTYTINLQASTVNNPLSAGFYIRYLFGSVDSINTTNAN